MKIKLRYPIYSLIKLRFLLVLVIFLLPKTILYAAEDNLASLQREVLAAKEKRMAFSPNKRYYANVPTRLPTASGKTNQAVPVKDNPVKVPVAVADPKEVAVSQKLPQDGNQYKFDFPDPRNFKTDPKLEPRSPKVFKALPSFSPPGNNQLTDGAAIYKVAISDQKISVKEAGEIAVANSIALQALMKKVEVAAAKVTEAKRGLFPTVQLQYDENGGVAPSGILGARFYRGRSQKINVSQPLYYGGELVLTVKQAQENRLSAEAECRKAKNELISQTREAYYSVVKAEYNVQYEKEVLNEATIIFNSVKKAHDHKLIPEVEYLNMVSQHQQVSFTLDVASNDLLQNYLALRQIMGLDSSADLPLELKLEIKKINPDFQKLLELAMRIHPELIAKQLAYLSAQDSIKIYEAKKKPRLDLRGSYGMFSEAFLDSIAIEDDNANLDLEKEWYLGIHGSIPLGASTLEYDQIKHQYGTSLSAYQGSQDWRHTVKLNLLDKLADVTDATNAQAMLLQAEADWQKARNDIIYKLKENFYGLQKALILMDSTMVRIHYQEKQNAVLKYNVSMLESLPSDYLGGLIDQSQNRFGFIKAVADYNVAVSNIAVTCGDPEYFEKNDK